MRQPTIEEYERLGEHLCVVDPILNDFARDHGYAVYGPLSGGRYPNRRISQVGSITRAIHIAMSHDSSGNRYCAFFPDVPYTIFGGVFIDDKANGVRWHSAHLVTRDIPFSILVLSLVAHLIHFHSYISGVTAEYVYSVGCKTPLAPSQEHA